GHDNHKDRDNYREDCADNGVEFPPRDILLLHLFVDNSTLLEKDHPWCDCRTDICRQKEEQFPVKSSREIGDNARSENIGDRGVDDNCSRDIDQVDKTKHHGDLLPRPVPSRHDDPEHDEYDDDDGEYGRYTEDAERCGHT